MTDVAYVAAAAMRVLGDAGSAALNWLAPPRLTTINESADKLWAETTAPKAATARQFSQAEMDLAVNMALAVVAGDFNRAIELLKKVYPEAAAAIAEFCTDIDVLLGGPFLTSSAGSAARTDESGPAAEDSPAPAVTTSPAGAGSHVLTIRELEAAAHAVRSHILKLIVVDDIKADIKVWENLAEKLEAAALSK